VVVVEAAAEVLVGVVLMVVGVVIHIVEELEILVVETQIIQEINMTNFKVSYENSFWVTSNR
jgi:hypothetical protein